MKGVSLNFSGRWLGRTTVDHFALELRVHSERRAETKGRPGVFRFRGGNGFTMSGRGPDAVGPPDRLTERFRPIRAGR